MLLTLYPFGKDNSETLLQLYANFDRPLCVQGLSQGSVGCNRRPTHRMNHQITSLVGVEGYML